MPDCGDGSNKWNQDKWPGPLKWLRLHEWPHDFVDFAVENLRCERPEWIWLALPREFRHWRHSADADEDWFWSHKAEPFSAVLRQYPSYAFMLARPSLFLTHRDAWPGGKGKDRAYLVGHLPSVLVRYWPEWRRSL